MKVVVRIERKINLSEGEHPNAQQHIWKGYDVGTGRYGWHWTPFGETAIYLGRSGNEALEEIQAWMDEREEYMR